MLSHTWAADSVPAIVLYVDGAILMVFAVLYMNQKGHRTLETMIGLPPSSNPAVVSMLLSIDGFSKLAAALLMILVPLGGVSSAALLAFSASHFGWAYLQFSQAANFHGVLRKHAQPNIGCLQIIFAVDLLYFFLVGEGVWADESELRMAVCAVDGGILCASGFTWVKVATKGVPGGEEVEDLSTAP